MPKTPQPKMTIAEREAAARARLAGQSTELLCAGFLLTETMKIDRAVAMTRGWIMDALEQRDPEAFGAWMDAVESPLPHSFYGVALAA